jgi:hypothetical protein
VQAIEEYGKLDVVRGKLAGHRVDGLRNLESIGLITWLGLAEVLEHARQAAQREDERAYAARAVAWLREKLLPGTGI